MGSEKLPEKVMNADLSTVENEFGEGRIHSSETGAFYPLFP